MTGIVAQFKDRPALLHFLRRWGIPVVFGLLVVSDVATGRTSLRTYVLVAAAMYWAFQGRKSKP